MWSFYDTRKILASTCNFRNSGDIVSIRTSDERETIFHNVLVRAGKKHTDDFRIYTDEANTSNLSSGDKVTIEVVC